MDDDNELELSLGLSCGGSSGKTKVNITGGSTDTIKPEEGDRSTKVIDDFKNFLHPGTQKQEPIDSVKPQENFFSDLSKTSTADASMKRFWVDEETSSNKRKLLLTEMNNQKKHEGEVNHTDFHEKKVKTSHISLATEDGSAAENQDVAESELGGSSDAAKEVRLSSDASVLDLTGQKRHNNSSGGEEFKIGNFSFGVPFSARPVNVTNVPYALTNKDANLNSNSAVVPGSVSGCTPSSTSQPADSGNLPVMFGYSPVQLPVLDKDSSWGLISHSHQLPPPYAGRVAPNLGKQQTAEEGSSNQIEDAKGSSTKLRTNDTSSHQPTQDNSFSFDFSAIKPGIAADVKFGGSGTCPNLPWVSTTGSGPHGRTISGVTYRYSPNQIRIVCACHGTHLSPEEFVRHASEEYVNPETSIGLAAASAQS